MCVIFIRTFKSLIHHRLFAVIESRSAELAPSHHSTNNNSPSPIVEATFLTLAEKSRRFPRSPSSDMSRGGTVCHFESRRFAPSLGSWWHPDVEVDLELPSGRVRLRPAMLFRDFAEPISAWNDPRRSSHHAHTLHHSRSQIVESSPTSASPCTRDLSTTPSSSYSVSYQLPSETRPPMLSTRTYDLSIWLPSKAVRNQLIHILPLINSSHTNHPQPSSRFCSRSLRSCCSIMPSHLFHTASSSRLFFSRLE